MADGNQLFDVLSALALGGLLGMIGQGLRAVAGLKKMNDDALATDATAADLFSAARLATSMMIGLIVGVATTLSLGPGKLISVDAAGATQILLGVIVAGYVGSDVIEAFTLGLAKIPTPRIVSPRIASPVEAGPVVTLPPPEPLPAPLPPAHVPPAHMLGRSATLRGRMSTFGGPDDKDVGPAEGLALMEPEDIDKYPGLFLLQQPPGTTGLARRLDPDAPYIACRWDYDETPRRHLRDIMVSVTNPVTGREEKAHPVDWGPHERTGRIADLSPGLAGRLKLATNQNCVITIPLPEAAAAPLPTRPTSAHLKVMTIEEIQATFGRFAYEEASPRGAIRITDSWPSDHVTTIEIEELSHLVRHGRIECHKLIAEPLKAAIVEIARRDLLDRVLKWEGCFVPRHKAWNPNRDLSPHSWGIAIDINAHWNAYGAAPAPKGARGSVVELVPIFESFGFAWGGYFRPDSQRDGMHFEFCRRAVGGGHADA